MPGELDQYGFERLQLTDLADLDRLVAERFELPSRPYSTDIRAAFELVIWALDYDEYPYVGLAERGLHCSESCSKTSRKG